MKKYPLIGELIPAPTQMMSPQAGVHIDLSTPFGVPIVMEGMTLQNEGATARAPGKIAVLVENTDVSTPLVVTPSVYATIPEVCGQELAAVPEDLTIPAGDFMIIGPFLRINETENQIVEFSFTGVEGRIYAFYTR